MSKRRDTKSAPDVDKTASDRSNGATTAPPASDAAERAENGTLSAEAAMAAGHAVNLRDVTGAAYLYGSTAGALSGNLGTDAYQRYRNQLIADCGSPRDPLIVMLLEQLALAHHNAGRLYLLSAQSKSWGENTALVAAAARLMAEYRRSLQALDEYRRKAAPASDSSGQTASDGRTNGKATSKAKPAKARRPTAGKKASANGQASKGEVPECLKERMRGKTLAALQPGGGTNGNGKG